MRFARMHVFPYSEREGTAAATMPDPVPRHIREERARELIALGAGMAEDYRRAGSWARCGACCLSSARRA